MSRLITEKTRSKLLDVTPEMVASGMSFVTLRVAAQRKGLHLTALQYAIDKGRLQGYIQHNVKLVAESDLAAYMPVRSSRVGRSAKGMTQTSAQDVGPDFGAKVKQWRIARDNMSQSELGQKSNIAQGDISDIERGIWRKISAEHVNRIATALGVTSADLL